MILLDRNSLSVLSRLEDFGLENDANELDRSHKMLNLERITAELLYTIVICARRQRILEIGTSNGYSTIWLANALRKTQGDVLLSVECSHEKVVQARKNLQAASQQDYVRIIEGDATTVCAQLRGTFDCVFFDADRVSAPEQLDFLIPRLTDDALLLADNALSHPEEIAGYIARIEELAEFDTLTVPVGKGLHIARRRSVHAPPPP